MAKRSKIILQAAVIASAVFWIFWPARHGQWIGDDNFYLSANPLLQDPARLWKAWFQPGSFIEYYPIEESLQWVQWQLWHTDTFGYHLTNILLHMINSLLVWRLLNKFGLRLAWLGGLIFAVHPMTVDSIALINEFKTALSMGPFLLAMCAYIDYEEHGRRRDYGLAVGLFAMAMLCKITMAMFPVVILLYAWWKRNRIGWADLVTSVPFFAISLVLGLTTLWAGVWYSQVHGVEPDMAHPGGFFSRLVLIGQIIAFYFARSFLPVIPLPVYPQWTVDPASPLQYLPWLILVGSTWYLWIKRKTWGRDALLGLGFILIMLAPFGGAKGISYMISTWVLDHLLYIPLVGLIGLVIAGLEGLQKQLPPFCRPYEICIVAGAVALLALQSHAYASRFTDEKTLCAYTLSHNPGSWLTHNTLGLVLLQEGHTDEAVAQFQKAVEIVPNNAEAHINLGVAFAQEKQMDEAMLQYQKALEINPNSEVAHHNLGNILYQNGQVDDAIAEYQKALKLNSSMAQVHQDLANAFFQKEQVDDAIAEYRETLRLNPDVGDAHYNLGLAFIQKGESKEAIVEFEEAVRLSPFDRSAQNNLARARALARQCAAHP